MITNGDLSCPHCRAKWTHRSSYDSPRLSIIVSSVADLVNGLNEDLTTMDLSNLSQLSISPPAKQEALEVKTNSTQRKRKKRPYVRKSTKKANILPPQVVEKEVEIENSIKENLENGNESSDKALYEDNSSESDNFLLKVFQQPVQDSTESTDIPNRESTMDAPISKSVLDLCFDSDSPKSPIFVKSQEVVSQNRIAEEQIVVIPETNFQSNDNSQQKCSQSSQDKDSTTKNEITCSILNELPTKSQDLSPSLSDVIVVQENSTILRDKNCGEQKFDSQCQTKCSEDWSKATQNQITRICSTLNEENEFFVEEPKSQTCSVITIDDSPENKLEKVTVDDSFVEHVDMTQEDSNPGISEKFSFKLDKDQIVICFSGFSSSEWKNYEVLFGSAFGVNISNKIDDRTSILVTKTSHSSNGKLCVRTLKYFQALVRRIPIVSHFWAEQCFKSKALITDLDDFIVDGNTSDGPTFGSKFSLNCKQNELLFRHVYFYIIEPLDTFDNKADLEDMIRRCHGTICQSLKDLQALCVKSECAFIVCQQTSHQNTYFDDLFVKYTVPVIDVEYVLSCISNFQLLVGFENYLICSRHLFDRDFALRTQKCLL